MLAAIPLIIPAAGKSSRLGSPKGLQYCQGQLWIERQCRAYHEAGGRTVLLILGYDRQRYYCALCPDSSTPPATITLGGCELHLLENPLPEWGPFSSLQCACQWIATQPQIEHAFYLPIDTPLPRPQVLADLVIALQPPLRVSEPRYRDRGGHPVLLQRELLLALAALDPTIADARLDLQLRRCREHGQIAAVAVDDPAVVLNLNDAAAWNRYVNSQPESTPTGTTA